MPATPLLVIGGPTASGKTSLGVALAKALDGEVISADSVQIFSGVEIGAATPTVDERDGVPHHLLGVVDPRVAISAADFQRMADAAIADVRGRGKQPILVGGSGLYLRALLYGLIDAPDRDDAIRARLEQRAEEEGNAALWQALHAVDPAAAARLHPNDRMRVVRALEVFELTGEPISSARADHGFSAPRYDYIGVGLTAPRPWVHDRINRRAALMFDAGLVEEVAALRRAGVPDHAQPFTAIGYREVVSYLQYLERRADEEREHTLDSTAVQSENGAPFAARRVPRGLVEDVATHTRNFARRQLVWFRKEEKFRWFNAETLDASDHRFLDAIRASLAGAPWAAGEADERAISGPAPTVRRQKTRGR